jgi:hypothetical protein
MIADIKSEDKLSYPYGLLTYNASMKLSVGLNLKLRHQATHKKLEKLEKRKKKKTIKRAKLCKHFGKHSH